MEKKQSKIAIIGLGLMGGSLGSALVRRGYTVAGWDNNLESITEAYRIGAINELSDNLQEVLDQAGVIFVATPVAFISESIKKCLPFVGPGAVFSDLGSIKEKIIREVSAFLPQDCYFVPGHPMTGSEKNGINAADPFLFENAAYILIDDPATPQEVLEKLKEILSCTGAHLMTLEAAEHDRIVGMVSHLPHLIAATLARTAGLAEEKHPGTLALAAGGFRDTTRIAMGSPQLWEEIIRGNRDKVLQAIDSFKEQLDILKSIVSTEEPSPLVEFLSHARETRLQIPAKNKGFLSLLHEMVVTIEDRPGAIGEVLRLLSKAEINIKDIEILRIREGDGGTLRLALENDQAVADAIVLLESARIKAWRR